MSHPFAKARRLAEQFRAGALLNRTAAYTATPSGVAPAAILAKSTKDAADTVGEIFLYEPIGFDCWTGSGVSAKSFAESLEKVKGVKTLNLYVNCEGGDVFEAKAMYAQLLRVRESGTKLIAHVDGIAASAATFLVMAAEKIRTNSIGTWMIHEAWSGAMGRAVDLRAMADLLEAQTVSIAETYAKRNGKSVDDMLALMSAPPDGTWMTAKEALDQGFTDEVVEPPGPDEESDGAKNSIRMPTFNALELTQQRLKSIAPGDLMRARAKFITSPASRGPAKPASR